MHAALGEGHTLAAQEYYLEGAFRNIHSRLRTHAESVAFFGGGEREGATISASFHALMQHLSAVIDIRRAEKRRSCASVICGIIPRDVRDQGLGICCGGNLLRLLLCIESWRA